MTMRVYRDIPAIRFIRCVATIPGTSENASGAGFTLAGAMVRCESEAVERAYESQVLFPSGAHTVGIAAHIDYPRAEERARHEALETLCLQQIHTEKKIHCLFRLKLGSHHLGITRTSSGYFGAMTGAVDDEPILAYSAARTLFGALLKMWEEFRNFQFFRPHGQVLKTYSKALLSGSELSVKIEKA